MYSFIFFSNYIPVISNSKTTTQNIDTTLDTISTTSSLNFTKFENSTPTISIDQSTPFNSTEYFNSTQVYSTELTIITTRTELPATIVSLNNLVVISPLNNRKISRVIIDPDEEFSAVKSEVKLKKLKIWLDCLWIFFIFFKKSLRKMKGISNCDKADGTWNTE